MNSQKKTLLVINVDNIVDIITNSSSELFVLEGQTKEVVEEMIKDIYPNYLGEYENIKHISELTNEELNNFLSYHCSAHCWPNSKSELPILDGFTFDELYEPKRDWETGEPEPPAWNGEIQYTLRNNSKQVRKKGEWVNEYFVSDENRERVIKAISNSVGNYFMYSIDENPNWEKQEDLMGIAKRYHLG